MAFKLKGFSYPNTKPSPKKFGTNKLPGTRANLGASTRADKKLEEVNQRRDDQGGPRFKTFMGKSTEGERVADGEYKMGLADMKLFGGPGKKALRDQGLALEGDTEKYIAKKRKKKNRQQKRGVQFDSWGDKIA